MERPEAASSPLPPVRVEGGWAASPHGGRCHVMTVPSAAPAARAVSERLQARLSTGAGWPARRHSGTMVSVSNTAMAFWHAAAR